MKSNIRFLSTFLMVTAVQAFAFGGMGTEKISYDSVQITEPYIAITFDDGPSSMLTPQVLKILADRNIKATFFVVGSSVQSHPEIIRQELNAGHEVGSRSWEHGGFSDMTGTQWLTDIQRTDQALKVATGRSPQLFAPFDATFTDVQSDTVNKQFSYKVITWSVDGLAMKDKGPAAIVSSIISQVKPGSIIMSSDINAGSVTALPVVLDTLISKGYKFVTVPELLAMAGGGGQKTASRVKQPKVAYVKPPQSTTPASTSSSPSSSSSSLYAHPFGVATPPPTVTVPDPAPTGTQ